MFEEGERWKRGAIKEANARQKERSPVEHGVMIEVFNQGCEVYARASITLTDKKYQEGAKAFLVHKAIGIALKRLSREILKDAKS